MKAVVLAAGRGTRMGELTRHLPKPMISVLGRPVLEHVLRRMVAAGLTDFILVVKHLAHAIKDYFGDGSRLGASISYVDQMDRYGTGAAYLSARALVGDNPSMLTFADVITSTATYSEAIRVFAESDGAGVVTVNRVDDPHTGAAVVIGNDGRIERVIEKPPKGKSPSNWNSSGIFIFAPVVFDYLEKLTPSWRNEYELADAQNLMIADGLAFYPSYLLEGDWLDVGSPAAVAVAEKLLAGDRVDP